MNQGSLFRVKRVLAAGLSLFLISCSSSTEELVVSDNSVQVHQSEVGYPVDSIPLSKKHIGKSGHADQRYIKPGAAVVLADPSARTVDDLSVHRLDFGFIASPGKGELSVSLGSSESLVVIAPTSAKSYDLAADELSLSVDVQAKSYGRHVLTFFTELDGLRRVVSVTIQAGPVEAKDLQKTVDHSNAPKIIPMKAKETISN